MPANTGEAGARHRVAFFAGKPAPTGLVTCYKIADQAMACARKSLGDCSNCFLNDRLKCAESVKPHL
ncbi:hypothetical protein D3C73_1552920 [compost metagenome]